MENYLVKNPRFSGWEQEVALTYSDQARRDIRDHLFVAFAEHEFYSDCDQLVLDFFNKHR